MILRLAIEIEQQNQIIVPLQLIAPTHRDMSVGVRVVEGGGQAGALRDGEYVAGLTAQV